MTCTSTPSAAVCRSTTATTKTRPFPLRSPTANACWTVGLSLIRVLIPLDAMVSRRYSKALPLGTGSSSAESWPVGYHTGGVRLARSHETESEFKAAARKVSAVKPDKWAQAQRQESSGRLSWSDAAPEDLLAAVAAATEDGAAVLLSRTSDGGALVVRVLTDAGSTPFYPANMAALNETLSMIVEVANGT